MALPDLPAEPDNEVLADGLRMPWNAALNAILERVDELLERVDSLSVRFGAVEETLERYRPLLELAEQRMTKPRFFGGAGRA
jgi:hypothetical protein